MASGRYQSDSKGWAALATSDQVREVLVAIAEQGKGMAVELASSFVSDKDTADHYIEHFNVRTDTVKITTKYGTHDAAAGILENTSGHTLEVEFGTSNPNYPGHHVLGNVRAQLEHRPSISTRAKE